MPYGDLSWQQSIEQNIASFLLFNEFSGSFFYLSLESRCVIFENTKYLNDWNQLEGHKLESWLNLFVVWLE